MRKIWLIAFALVLIGVKGPTELDIPELPAVQASPPASVLWAQAVVGDAMRRYGIDYDLAMDIYRIATEEGVDPQLVYAVIRVESAFNERAVGPVGEVGLMQLMPSTARHFSPGISREEMFDREFNIRTGTKFLRYLLDKYDNEKLALLAYNRGPGTVDRHLRYGLDPANGYAQRVFAHYME